MKTAALMVFCLIFGGSLFGLSHGITLGTFNPGSSVVAGTTFGITQRFEAELFSVIPAAPIPFSGISGGAAVTASLSGPRELHSGEGTLFFGAYLSAGYLYGADSHGVFLRLTPLAVGGPYYGIRERAASVNLFYDIKNSEFSVFWNIFLIDLYF